jgi:dGTPase
MAPSDGERFREYLERLEERNLEKYALKSRERREQLGKSFREAEVTTPLEYRTEYHRDRDRIVWSKSFKRLQNKTQVFPHYVQDHYKRRLTHSLEVVQIATTIARSLRLNEVATEAMALGHDLGHTPFGHAGETALNKILKAKCSGSGITAKKCPVPIVGFDHCVHAIEVVSRIEEEYTRETNRGGLNLSFDVREGILKHMYERPPDRKRPLSHIGSVTRIRDYQGYGDNRGSLEAQCVYFADKLAYLLGDIEDGIRSDILSCSDLMKHEFMQRLSEEFAIRRGGRRLDLESVKSFPSFRSQVLTTMILDCIRQAEKSIRTRNIRTVEDVLNCNTRVIWVGDTLSPLWGCFYDTCMYGKLFKHHDVVACGFKAQKIVTDLFNACYGNTDLINDSYQTHCAEAYADVCNRGSCRFKLIVARNYVAGMTDSFATQQHARLFMSSERISV